MNKSFKIMCLCALLSCPTILGKDNMFNKSTVLASQRKVDKPSNEFNIPSNPSCVELTLALLTAAAESAPNISKTIEPYLKRAIEATEDAQESHIGLICTTPSEVRWLTNEAKFGLRDCYEFATGLRGFNDFKNAISKAIKNKDPDVYDKLYFSSFIQTLKDTPQTIVPNMPTPLFISSAIVNAIAEETNKIKPALNIFEIYNNFLEKYGDCLPFIYVDCFPFIYYENYKLPISNKECKCISTVITNLGNVARSQRKIISDKTEEITRLQNELNSQSRSEQISHNNEVAALNNKISTLENILISCRQHEQEYNTMLNKIQLLEQGNQNLKIELAEANGEVEALRNTRETLQRRLNKAEEKLSKISQPDHSAPISPVGQAENVFATVNTSEEYENYAKLNMPIPFNLIGEFLTEHGENQVVIEKAIKMSQDAMGFKYGNTTYKGMPVFHKTLPCDETLKGLTLFAIPKPDSISKPPATLSANDLWLIATGEHIKDDSTKKVYNLKYSVVEEAVQDIIVLGTEISK